MKRLARLVCLAFGIIPIAIYSLQDPPEKTAEQVYKDVQSFKGVPASDMIPAMQFMSAALGYQCRHCHDTNDYAADTHLKTTTREMIELQRDINKRYFKGRLEVTCMSCHNGKEHPTRQPMPTGVTFNHDEIDNPPTPEALFAKQIAAMGKVPAALVRTGSMTSPNLQTDKVETHPIVFTQAEGGKFRAESGDKKFGSDGKTTWFGANTLSGESAAVFDRIGRAWRGETAFAGLDQPIVTGKTKIGKNDVIVVTAPRPATGSTEQLYFDAKTHLLTRVVNLKRSTIGNVVSAIDFSDYKDIRGTRVPMKVVVTFAGGEPWIMDFRSAKVEASAQESLFQVGG
ncbi:MAG TPA: photosynthetic reaction center cytochrome c subunit family protein [Fimbriimonadaceae bacterium]|nr:photosynthetic reaction center cytochrome c subunit family protein [Fimbriimonadaceae bacterium]